MYVCGCYGDGHVTCSSGEKEECWRLEVVETSTQWRDTQ